MTQAAAIPLRLRGEGASGKSMKCGGDTAALGGKYGPRAVKARTAELMEALRATGFEAAGEPTAWFYDPPWTLPFRRRNEIAVPVNA